MSFTVSPTVQDPAVQERIAAVRKWLEANGTYEQRQEWLAIQKDLAADLKLWKRAMIRFYFRHPEFYQLLWAHHRLMARFHALSPAWPGISVCVDEEAIATFMLSDKEFDRVPENQRVTSQGGNEFMN